MVEDLSAELYPHPSPYEVLNLEQGPAATIEEISVACNRAMFKAKRIRDPKEKSRVLESLGRAKEFLLRPEDRISIDFFLLGGSLFGDLACQVAERLSTTPMPVEQVLGGLTPKRPFDDLVPDKPQRLLREFPSPVEFSYYETLPSASQRVALTDLSL